MNEKRYKILSNIWYALKNIWKWDKIFYFWFFPAIPLDVIVPLMGIYFPKLIIDAVEQKKTIAQMLGIIISYFVLLFVADTWRRFFKSKRNSRRNLICKIYQFKIFANGLFQYRPSKKNGEIFKGNRRCLYHWFS